jgi:hypothetical protein
VAAIEQQRQYFTVLVKFRATTEPPEGGEGRAVGQAARLSAFRPCFLAGFLLWIQAGRLSMTIVAITPGCIKDRNMVTTTDDARFFVDRVKEVAERLDAIAEKATDAGVEVLDGLNQRAANKSVSALENLCADLEIRVKRRQNMRRTG